MLQKKKDNWHSPKWCMQTARSALPKTESLAPFLQNRSSQIKVPKFLFLALWCVLANVSQNCDGTWQRHKRAVCFGKRQKITVSYSKFSRKTIIQQKY
jgi:hypothetical protein